MANLKNKITFITLGFRVKRAYKIDDISGDLFDEILDNPTSPFTKEKMFPTYNVALLDKRIQNETTEEYLRITPTDIILNVQVTADFDTKISWLKEDVITFFEKLFLKFGITNFQRFGIVFNHKLNTEKRLSNSIKDFLDEISVSNPERFNMVISKKETSFAGRSQAGVNDYKNKIYTFQNEDSELIANLDCQYYYEPLKEDFRECFIREIIDDSVVALSDFHEWLNKYVKVQTEQ